jgi:hypothetical protein
MMMQIEVDDDAAHTLVVAVLTDHREGLQEDLNRYLEKVSREEEITAYDRAQYDDDKDIAEAVTKVLEYYTP